MDSWWEKLDGTPALEKLGNPVSPTRRNPTNPTVPLNLFRLLSVTKVKKKGRCQVLCDYIPKRSYPLLHARKVLRLLAEEGIEGSAKEVEPRGDGV